MQKGQYVQGDVYLFAAQVPKGANKIGKNRGRYVLAEGEATGHAHVIEEDVAVYEEGGILYIANEITINLRHEEHKEITIPPGQWRVGIVQEYDPFEQEARKVQD